MDPPFNYLSLYYLKEKRIYILYREYASFEFGEDPGRSGVKCYRVLLYVCIVTPEIKSLGNIVSSKPRASLVIYFE
jgi:hypothetical protein